MIDESCGLASSSNFKQRCHALFPDPRCQSACGPPRPAADSAHLHCTSQSQSFILRNCLLETFEHQEHSHPHRLVPESAGYSWTIIFKCCDHVQSELCGAKVEMPKATKPPATSGKDVESTLLPATMNYRQIPVVHHPYLGQSENAQFIKQLVL